MLPTALPAAAVPRLLRERVVGQPPGHVHRPEGGAVVQGGGGVAVARLLCHQHQRRPGAQPAGGGGVAEHVRGHPGQPRPPRGTPAGSPGPATGRAAPGGSEGRRQAPAGTSEGAPASGCRNTQWRADLASGTTRHLLLARPPDRQQVRVGRRTGVFPPALLRQGTSRRTIRARAGVAAPGPGPGAPSAQVAPEAAQAGVVTGSCSARAASTSRWS